MSTYTPPYQLTDAILRLSTEIAATVKEITVRGNLSAQPQLHRANRIRSVHSSLAIEHNSLTLDLFHNFFVVFFFFALSFDKLNDAFNLLIGEETALNTHGL